jgi:hypothetical protein
MSKLLSMIAAAAVVAAAGTAALAQAPRDQGAAANVRESQIYEQVLHTNPAFRAKRIQQECGPINAPQLHDQCVASFGPPPVARPHR